MGILAVKLIFDVPDWPVALSASAGLLLAFELMAMLRRIWTGREPAAALSATGLVLLPGILAVIGGWASGQAMALLALLSGPLIFAGVTAHRVMTSLGSGESKARPLVREAFYGPAIATLAVLACYYPGGGSILAIACCCVLWVFRGYSRTTSPLKAAWRAALMGLRIAAILLLAVWLARPGLEYMTEVTLPSIVLIGIDSSASMQRRDMPANYKLPAGADNSDPARRIDAVRQAIRDQTEAIQALADNGEANLFTFAIKSRPLALLKPKASMFSEALSVPEPNDVATAIGDSVNDAFSPYAQANQRISAILLLTDGCNNTSDIIDPEKEAELMGSRGVPIFTVGIGSDKVTASTRTLNVRDLRSADMVEAFNRLPFTASVEAMGLKGKQIKVTAKFGEQDVEGPQTFVPNSDNFIYTCRLVHVPMAAGYHRLTVTAQVVGAAVAGLEGAPSASKLVHVQDRELRVLYVEGKFRYETKYLTQALIAAKRFSLDRRVLLQPVGQTPKPALSDNPDDWLRYHAIIIGDVEASHFTPKQLAIIKDLVGNKGKGLCMIGGSKSFGRGGWAATPVADVLPIDLATSQEQIDAPVRVVPTDEGLRNEIMRIGPDDKGVAAEWAAMGPLNGANKLGKPKPAALVLARSPQGDPLIVMQNYGGGRSLAIAFDTTWQWVLTPNDTAERQRRFWRQVALYLAAPKGNVWIGTDKTSYEFRRLVSGADIIEVTAGVEDASGQPSPQSLKEVTLSGPIAPGTTTLPAVTVPVTLEPRDNVLKGRLAPPSGPGIYVLKIKAEIQGKELTAEHKFEVLERNLENLEVLANFELLKKIAAASNGKFEPLSNIAALLKDLLKTAKPKPEIKPVHEDFADFAKWPLVIVIIALFCLEWALRKRRGLV